jgi:uncharacterized protein (TIGR03435 family)
MKFSNMISICCLGFAFALLVNAQAPAPAFDVASVKPNKSGDMGARIMFQPGGRFEANNASLKTLLEIAYDVRDFQVSGGPAWMSSDRYDIQAKAEGRQQGDLRTETEEQRKADLDRRRLMIQALLAERLKLAVHKESKESTIYALVVAKGGPKIKELPPETTPAPDPKDAPKESLDKPDPKRLPRGMMRMGPGELTAQGVKIISLANSLSNAVGHPVFDKTGLTGDYTYELKWAPDENHGDAASSADANGPSIFTALTEQLGLKLESQKGPVDVIVIDHAEKASEN